MIEVRYIYDVCNQPVNEYTIRNGRYALSMINLGATITKIVVPNGSEKLENITLRYHDYSFYKTNEAGVGCLLNYDLLSSGSYHPKLFYFNCTFEKNALIFKYQKEEYYMNITFSLNDHHISIIYDSNIVGIWRHLMHFNLSGNLKDNILSHEVMLDGKVVNLHTASEITKLKGNDISLINKDNGIHCRIFPQSKEVILLMSKGTPILKFNKGTPGFDYIGIGIISPSDCIRYEFH